MYKELTDKMKGKIDEMSAFEVFTRSKDAFDAGKISATLLKEMNGYWLNKNGKIGRWQSLEQSELEEEAHKIFN